MCFLCWNPQQKYLSGLHITKMEAIVLFYGYYEPKTFLFALAVNKIPNLQTISEVYT